MINDHTLAHFQPFRGGLVKPLHDYSFGRLAATFHRVLTGAEVAPALPVDCFGGQWPAPRRIVLFFIDSFGWQFWQRWAGDSRILRQVTSNGIVTPISALFPSTTSASVTTLNLGCLPAEHAVYEWNMYVPAFGETIQSLPFTTLGHRATAGEAMGWNVDDLVAPRATLHQGLAAHGVRSIQLAHGNYAGSQYNRVASAGAEVRVHFTLAEALVQLREAIETISDKALIQFYWAGLDTAAHIHGPGSRVHEAEVRAFWAALDTLLADMPCRDTLFLFTADHGQVRVPAEETIFLNERWPELATWLTRSPTGKSILPNGSPRDIFLHIAPEHRSDALHLLTGRLDGIAEVMDVDDLIAEGVFGPSQVGAELRRRLGDIAVLPHPGHFVWWRQRGLIDNRFHGHHGGLSREELISVLGVADAI